MSFYDQYTTICSEKGLDPCSQKAAKMFGITRATISAWKTKNTMPKGETVAVIANTLHVSADYLLCRTNDPTDYSSKKTLPDESSRIVNLYNKLDYLDQVRVEAYIEGILTKDKYI
ncbi:MAG: helix-turn-helix transcriptional regulator [Lachnospiraceae bacterium]|jgi:transcriptional regulator with XRE-family HTH domain|nr:helix-turn-helix transcriptional regulator [Lachnospiraceae bacterium]